MTIYIHKVFILATVMVTYMGLSFAMVPKNCEKWGAHVSCRAYIPDFLYIYGWNLSSVTSFSLQYGWALKTLPVDIFERANNITYLSMGNVGLENLPCGIFQPFKNSLETIYLSGNDFIEFPVCTLRNFVTLKYVYLDSMQLKSFKADHINWKSVREIYLRNNDIRRLNISDLNNQDAINLYLDSNYIFDLQLYYVHKIRYLSARNNHIRSINYNIFKNSETTLKYLDMSYNELDNSIWQALERISTLQTLKLKSNKISIISSSFLNAAKNLEFLDLSSNQLTSLAGVKLRSGNLTDLLFSSNKLTKIPRDMTSSTETFSSSPRQYDLSNNFINEIHVSIPTVATSLKVRLDRNKLKTVTFENSSEIYILNVSCNLLSVLPKPLPRANTYVLSHNPFNSDNIIEKLKNDMTGARNVEMENVNLLCGETPPKLSLMNLMGLHLLNLKHNCVPLDIICYIQTSCNTLMSLYLDNNTGSYHSCSLKNKCFEKLSLTDCGMNETIFKQLFSPNLHQFIRKISVKSSSLTDVPLIKTITSPDGHFSADYYKNKVKSFNGFDIAGRSLSINFASNKVSSIKPGIFRYFALWSPFLTFNYASNSLANLNDTLAIVYAETVSFYNFRIWIDVSSNFIRKIQLKDLIQVHIPPDFKHGDIELKINISNNSIQHLEGCLPSGVDYRLKIYTTLDFSYNSITALPYISCLWGYKMYFGYNKIREIRTPLPEANTITLDLQWNRIEMIHEKAFDSLTVLGELILRGNRLKWLPLSVKALRYLSTLDISFNMIRFVSQSDFKNLKSLYRLIIMDNFFLYPAYEFQLSNLPHLEGNGIHCDCDLLFLRNISDRSYSYVTGRCTSPPLFKGYNVLCFPVSHCFGFVPLYIPETVLNTCKNDNFFDIHVTTEETENTTMICITIFGQQRPYIRMDAYRNSTLIKQVRLNIIDQNYTLWIDRSQQLDRLCFVYNLNDEKDVSRCFAVQSQGTNQSKECPIDIQDENNGIIYVISSFLAMSLIFNISVAVLTLVTTKDKLIRISKRFLNGDNDNETYEIPSVVGNGNSENVIQPVYDELTD